MPGFSTRAIRAASRVPPAPQAPVNVPIYQTSTFEVGDAEELAELLEFSRPGHSYTRYSNPTHAALEEALAELEGADAALATASGMAAIHAAVLSTVRSGESIVIPGDPMRTRDFVYVDDFAAALEQLVSAERWDETLTVASGEATPLLRAAELVNAAAGSSSPIETPGGELAPGENESYSSGTGLRFAPRPLAQAVELYVDWLARHHPAQGRA